MHQANPVATPSGCGLNKERIAQALSVTARISERFHWAAAPRHYRYPRLLGQALGGDFVTHPPHRIAIRADEHDTQFTAKVGECGVFRNEAPSRPNRICAPCNQRPFQATIVDVTALELLSIRIDDLSGTKTHRLVGFPHKEAMAVSLGEECDRAQRCAVFLVEIASSVNEPHGRFATIHDGHTLELELHKSSDLKIVRTTGYVLMPRSFPGTSRPVVPLTLLHPQRWESPRCGNR